MRHTINLIAIANPILSSTKTLAIIIYPSIFSILFLAILIHQFSYAFTYESQDWWFAREGGQEVTGDLGIIFTYPDTVMHNDPIDVTVRIEYMDNENARGEYAILDDLRVHLRNNNTRLDGDIASSEPVISPILRPGNNYSRTFSISTKDLLVGNYYAIDLSFVAHFGIKTKLENYLWDSGEKYGTSIEPWELKPLLVIDRNGTESKHLTLRVNKPAGFGSVQVHIDNKSFAIQNGTLTYDFQDRFSSNQTESTSPEDHRIKVDEFVPLLRENGHDVMRGKFASWSDGVKDSERTVSGEENEELFAIYTTEYYLNTSSKDYPNKIVGGGWYDAGSMAQIYVSNASSNPSQSFDHWIGDLSSDIDQSSTSISFTMDGPKNIQAKAKQNELLDSFKQSFGFLAEFFYGFIAAAIIGPLVAWVLTIIYSRKEKKRNLIYLRTYIPLIDDILKQYIGDRELGIKLLNQKRSEITTLLQAGIINVETYRLLSEHITDSAKEHHP